MPIRSWDEGDRPREKLLEKGAQALSNAELIAILLGSGSRNESAVELSKRILQTCANDINKLARLSPAELMKFQGVGLAKAVTLVASMELARRKGSQKNISDPHIKSSADVHNYMSPLLADLVHEEFWVLFLYQSNRVITRKKISQGGLAGTVIDVRIILKEALLISSPAIILCHNHPSGNVVPSNSDKSITSKIKNASSTLDIRVLDHVIIGGDAYYSFADEGDL